MVSAKAPEVAIVYVFDSSVDLANEWGRVKPTTSGQYMQHLVARLREGHPDLQTVRLLCCLESPNSLCHRPVASRCAGVLRFRIHSPIASIIQVVLHFLRQPVQDEGTF